jgi:hypothetical protein
LRLDKQLLWPQESRLTHHSSRLAHLVSHGFLAQLKQKASMKNILCKRPSH